MIEDIKDYLERGLFEDAGIALGMWIKEIVPEIDDLDIIELINALDGELYP
jgi:hypothetical protein